MVNFVKIVVNQIWRSIAFDARVGRLHSLRNYLASQ